MYFHTTRYSQFWPWWRTCLIPVCTLVGAAAGWRGLRTQRDQGEQARSTYRAEAVVRLDLPDTDAVPRSFADPQLCLLAASNANPRNALPLLAHGNPGDPAAQHLAIQFLSTSCSETRSSDPNLVRLTATSNTRVEAAAIADAFAEALVQRDRGQAARAEEARLDRLRKDVEESDRRLKELLAHKQQISEKCDTSDIVREEARVAGEIRLCAAQQRNADQSRAEASANLQKLGETPAANDFRGVAAARRQREMEDAKANDPSYLQAAREEAASAREYWAERGGKDGTASGRDRGGGTTEGGAGRRGAARAGVVGRRRGAGGAKLPSGTRRSAAARNRRDPCRRSKDCRMRIPVADAGGAVRATGRCSRAT